MRAFSVDEVGDYLADGYWAETGGWHPPVLDDKISVNLTGLSAANQALVKLALQAWSTLGFTFNYTTSGRADIQFSDDYSGGYTNWTDRGGLALVNVGPDFTSAHGSQFGSYTYQSWLHEIGHALGLGHTGAYNGTGTYGVDNHFTNDSWQMSVMSYFPQDENTSINASFAYVLTPMPGDIAAIDELYDLDVTINQGNTVYFWATNAEGIYGHIGRELQSGRLNAPVTLTVVDHGGLDTLNFRGSNKAVNLDLRGGSISSALGLRGNILIDEDTIIERANGSTANDIIRGQAAANILDGGTGNDVLDGRVGNDVLIGGTGNDSLFGGAGNDVLRGGAGADALNGGAGIDIARYDNVATIVDLAIQTRNAGSAAGDRLTGVERVDGGNANDQFFGDAFGNLLLGGGGNDYLDGRAGNDTLVGGAGDDRLIGGAGADLLKGEAGRDMAYYTGGAVTVDLVTRYHNTGDAKGDILQSVEDISGSAFTDKLRGDEGANRLIGNGGHDVLDGRGGNDRLEGGDGNDLVIGGTGNDLLSGGAGNDRLLVNGGVDTVLGGLGADDFEFWGGQMRVSDFQNNVDELVLDLDQLGLSGASVADILDRATVINGHTHLNLGNGNSVILFNVAYINDLADDLVFV